MIQRVTARFFAVSVLVLAPMAFFATSASASTPSGCSDVRQIGSTATFSVGGQTAGSVKLYYSAACHSVFSYMWIWDSFRSSHSGWNVSLAICEGGSGTTHCTDWFPFKTWSNTSQQEFWSNGTGDAYPGCVPIYTTNYKFQYNSYSVTSPDSVATVNNC